LRREGVVRVAPGGTLRSPDTAAVDVSPVGVAAAEAAGPAGRAVVGSTGSLDGLS
jgi:hypothetical protein